MTDPLLRPMRPDTADVAAVLELNEANVAVLSPMDADRLTRLRAWADRTDVVEVDGEVAGFAMTFAAGSDYDSENFRWFAERYPDFYYLDRVAFAPRFRRRGLGSFVYDELEQVAARHGRLALEVNARPANEPSLAFHAGRGFVEVGRRTYADGTEVSMLVLEAASAGL